MMFRLDFQIHACFWQSHGKSTVCVEVGQLHGTMYSGKKKGNRFLQAFSDTQILADKWKYVTST